MSFKARYLVKRVQKSKIKLKIKIKLSKIENTKPKFIHFGLEQPKKLTSNHFSQPTADVSANNRSATADIDVKGIIRAATTDIDVKPINRAATSDIDITANNRVATADIDVKFLISLREQTEVKLKKHGK